MRTMIRLAATLLLVPLLFPLAAAAAVDKPHELELVGGYYYPSDVELELPIGPTIVHGTIGYHETFSYGLRYGYRASETWGLGVTWTHVDLDAGRSDSQGVGCSTCDFGVDFADFSGEWYPGGGKWALYAGLGWASGDLELNLDGDSNDLKISDDAFTYHIGTAWRWDFGESFYIRPDARLRFLQLDKDGRGKYDSEDPEFRLGFGWRL
ncbi:MAG TPA: outer membrane beta-barrel protein [Thermoanaerobaculia bacterium]|nr:outer membrane beta-barrel protein [Thermoanaerobaculia bacterium]